MNRSHTHIKRADIKASVCPSCVRQRGRDGGETTRAASQIQHYSTHRTLHRRHTPWRQTLSRARVWGLSRRLGFGLARSHFLVSPPSPVILQHYQQAPHYTTWAFSNTCKINKCIYKHTPQYNKRSRHAGFTRRSKVIHFLQYASANFTPEPATSNSTKTHKHTILSV